MGHMTLDRFGDRLDAAPYADDPVVGVFESDPDEADSLWLSDRLFASTTRWPSKPLKKSRTTLLSGLDGRDGPVLLSTAAEN